MGEQGDTSEPAGNVNTREQEMVEPALAGGDPSMDVAARGSDRAAKGVAQRPGQKIESEQVSTDTVDNDKDKAGERGSGIITEGAEGLTKSLSNLNHLRQARHST
jgi:hypothetical protein